METFNITKRNHYNPCFWTAFWNNDYYEAQVGGRGGGLVARSQPIYALSVKSGNIFGSTVENIHFEKNLCFAEITYESAKSFLRRRYPSMSEDAVGEESDYPVFLDFEDVLTALESSPPYKVLVDVIKRGDLTTLEEKSLLACFVMLQLVRSHSVMRATLEFDQRLGIDKFESFIMLYWMLRDGGIYMKTVLPLTGARWTIFRVKSDTFPLTDSPILVQPHSIMVALSPRLLLEVSQRFPAGDRLWRVKNSIKPGKLAEFRRRTIGNTFREIIFSNRSVLEFWRGTREFQSRVQLINSAEQYNTLVHSEQDREIWSINAHGNQ